MQRKLPVPKAYVKKIVPQDIPLEKVYGRGAFDDSMKNQNRLNEWSYVVPGAMKVGTNPRPQTTKL
jgi:hypothetical protein